MLARIVAYTQVMATLKRVHPSNCHYMRFQILKSLSVPILFSGYAELRKALRGVSLATTGEHEFNQYSQSHHK